MIKNEHFQFEILDSNLVDPEKPILACYKHEEKNVILFEATSTQCCQGLSLVLDPEINYGDLFLCPFPYLNSGFLYGVRNPIEEICGLSDVEKELGITGMLNIDEMRLEVTVGITSVVLELRKLYAILTIQLHLRCSKRLGSKSANPYYDLENGFHIVFYEKIGYWIMPSSESWKTGNLYLKTAGAKQMFTKSESRNDPQEEESELCWTIMLLSPSNFFLSHDAMDDINNISQSSSNPDIRDVVIQKCMLTAELTSILYAMSIEDNIKQWTLFREARVESYLERNQVDVSRNKDSSSTSSKMKMGEQKKVPGVAEEIDIELPYRNADVPKESESSASYDNLGEDSQKKIKNLANKIDMEVESLINWQSQFKHQQETAQAYRDGLFNASALMESRASTRLGENVKLLTYVSIFYLPLVFCAALWAIPNITSSGTRSPFILTTILVGFVTYMIVFNLGNIVKQSRRVYEPYRLGVIKQICKQSPDDKESWRADEHASSSFRCARRVNPLNDLDSEWEKRAQRFESIFGPKRGDGEPSEWWIPIYSMAIISKWILVHFRASFQWIGQFFGKVFASFGNAFQWIRQLLGLSHDSTLNTNQEDSITNHTRETV
ncbi:hypothetical protein BOTNAR_0812g00010 [Botryotinia narcissicola]|uniref:Uncharacterized protein n=1 Tax=Botryotinia narcissicola TaxID=278944 RepID=A0A4Z1H8M5_9HELO|nr:hypothetical protein BOTNAR_0812g00010 [Botryotinia narcissicola]